MNKNFFRDTEAWTAVANGLDPVVFTVSHALAPSVWHLAERSVRSSVWDSIEDAVEDAVIKRIRDNTVKLNE